MVDISNSNINWDDLTVNAAPPFLPEISNQAASVTIPFTLAFNEAFGGSSPYTYTVVGNPSWLSLSDRTLSGTPGANDTASHTITIIVTDNNNQTASQFI